MGRIVAIDWGGKRTGLAWTDPLKIIATGVGSFDTAGIMAYLIKLVSKEEVEEFVLGEPMRFDGSPTDSTAAVMKFKTALEKQFPNIPVSLWDERFTSKQALQAMIEGGVKKKRRSDKHLINEVSATLILQSYMEQLK